MTTADSADRTVRSYLNHMRHRGDWGLRLVALAAAGAGVALRLGVAVAVTIVLVLAPVSLLGGFWYYRRHGWQDLPQEGP